MVKTEYKNTVINTIIITKEMFYSKLMKKKTLIIILGMCSLSFTFQTNFLSEQRKFQRVRTAITEKQQIIENKLSEYQITIDNLNLLIVAYKDNDILEVYAKNKQEAAYRKILSYNVCSRSGQLGPKRKQGDGQVPEGFYHIDRFNPSSSYYLSLGINYPNLADKRKSKATNLGGDIFIHGSCVTIGCLPMTDNYIKEIYLAAVYAKNNGQAKIPVYIFPFQMTDQNLTKYKADYVNDKELTDFWDNLKIGYDKFMKDKKELQINVAPNGDYTF